MEVTVENNKLNEVEHELRVSVPADYMRDELERGMAAVMQHAKIPGFRPGKIPRNVSGPEIRPGSYRGYCSAGLTGGVQGRFRSSEALSHFPRGNERDSL